MRALIALFAATKLLLHLLVLRPYGYFRDELYYLACADHLALGYVDHPPLSVAVLAAWKALFGDSIETIRLVPALAGAGVVALTGRIVRQLGGNGIAVAIACTAVLFAPARLGTDHYYSMNALDALLWVGAATLALDATTGGSTRSWLALGALLGLGFLNKWSIFWLGFGLGVGLLVTELRGALRSRGPYLAALIAAVVAAPSFVWQAQNQWPTLEFMRNAMEHKYVRPTPLAFLTELALMINPAAALVVVVGLVSGLAGKAGRGGRLLACIVLGAAVIVVGSRGKAEYLVAATPLVLAPGAVFVESLLGERRGLGVAIAVAIGLVALPALPFALPVLSVESFISYQARLGIEPKSSEKKQLGALPQFYADMHGWPELVDAAAQAYETLSPDEKAQAPIWALTGGYGPAAAIDVLGKRQGLPRAISGHNNYWLWGYGADQPPAVIILGHHPRLTELFEELTPITRVECGFCMPYENDKPVYVGRRMRAPFSAFWADVKRFE